ncbi:MAG: Exonuclease V gamma subunit [Verrucomicrobia bacterium]|nr:MAG: Exonuclease V gamma subunit [Verrucomicrobiota bacterium]
MSLKKSSLHFRLAHFKKFSRPPSAFHPAMTLIHSDSPQSAFGHLLEELRRMQREPLAQCWLVVPSHNWGDSILQSLAQSQGVASGVCSSNLRALLESIAKTDPRRCLSTDSLTLLVLEQIRHTSHPADSLVFSALGADDEARPLRELAIAQALAEALDAAWLHPKSEHAFLSRPEIQHLLENEVLQAAASDHLGRISAESFAAACQTWLKTEQAKGGPVRLAVLLDRSVPALLLARLGQLLEIAGGSLVVSASVNDFWADDKIKSRRRSPSGDSLQTPAPHLLYALGANAQDLHRGLIEHFEAEGAGFLYPTDSQLENPPSLLSALQQDTRSLHLRQELFVRHAEDPSLAVYNCRSMRRELELIADQFRGELSRDPSLKPEDCRVLLVDPAEYAPLLKAIFLEAGVPVHFPEMPPQQSLEIIAALDSLIEALRGRFDLAEGLRLLQHPPITRRFELEAALTEGHLAKWLRDAGVRWGRNREHRAQEQQHPNSPDTWSWAFGLQRLALGAVLPAHSNNTRVTLAGGTHHVPLLRAAGLETATLANLADFLERFNHHAAFWKRGAMHTLEMWCDAIAALCEAFFDQESQEQLLGLNAKVLAPLRRSNLPARKNNPSNAFLKSEISAEVFLRLFHAKLDAFSEQLMKADRMSGVIVSDLRKDAALPAQILAIAGLGGDKFPRADSRPDWHPLKTATGTGIPSKRGEDRHFLLQAALCPQRRLILTYVGGSLHDDKGLPPSTPLSDLLEAVAKTAGVQAAADIQINVPLHPFSTASFLAGLPPFARGQQPNHLADARMLAASHQNNSQRFHQGPLPPEDRLSVDIAELKRALIEPHKIYLARLGLGWFEQPSAFPSGELLNLNPLQKWSLRDSILTHRLHAANSAPSQTDPEAVRELLTLRGILPAAPRDRKSWEHESEKTPAVLHCPIDPHPAIQLVINGVQLTGQIDTNWRLSQGVATLYLAGKSGNKYELRALVDALVLSLAAPALGLFQIQFSKAKPEDKPLPPKDITHLVVSAQAQLACILNIHRLAGCLPLPFFLGASAKLKDTNPQDAANDLATALEAWKTKDSFGEDPMPSEYEALSVQIAFSGIENPFTEPFELPESLAPHWLPEHPGAKLSITLAQTIFGLIPKAPKTDA